MTDFVSWQFREQRLPYHALRITNFLNDMETQGFYGLVFTDEPYDSTQSILLCDQINSGRSSMPFQEERVTDANRLLMFDVVEKRRNESWCQTNPSWRADTSWKWTFHNDTFWKVTTVFVQVENRIYVRYSGRSYPDSRNVVRRSPRTVVREASRA